MLKRMLCLAFVVFALSLAMNIKSASAADQWFYTDSNGAKYYLRKSDMARSWIGGCVVNVYADGDSEFLLYKFEDAPQCPYSICYGESFAHPGEGIERGYMYGGGYVNPSAQALYENCLKKEAMEAAARRREVLKKHR